MSKIHLSKTAQKRHERALFDAIKKMIKQPAEERAESRKRLEALLAQKTKPKSFDPIENAMRDHPGLTRQEAERLAHDLGFG